MPNLIAFVYCVTLWGVPTLFAFGPVLLTTGLPMWAKIAGFTLSPFFFILFFSTIAGLLSLPAQSKIIRGKFPREPLHKIYFWRRIYGLCWTSLYYFKPIYHAVLSIPVLRGAVFHLFGYRGSNSITVYPDTWIRDLPLLKIGAKAYLSNRATLGTNMCLTDGTIFVDYVTIDEQALVGHLAMIAPGCKLGKQAEIGVGAAIGIRCRIAEGAKVGGSAAVSHGTIMGKNSEVGAHTYIGLRANIGEDVKIPAGISVPAGAVIANAADAERLTNRQSMEVFKVKEELQAVFMSVSAPR